MIDSIYQTAQSLLNKDQLGYLPPFKFNQFINNACNKVYNKLLSDLKSNVRKMNWMLDGKHLADYSEHVKQLVEHLIDEENVPVVDGVAQLPTELEFVEDVYVGNTNTPIEKVDYSDFKLLQRNIYASPHDCSPICSKLSRTLKIAPNTISDIDLHYLRQPKTAKWTFEDDNGKPMFDPTKSDYQDVDMPYSVKDELISLVVEMGSKYLRDPQKVQMENQEQAQDIQIENRQ